MGGPAERVRGLLSREPVEWAWEVGGQGDCPSGEALTSRETWESRFPLTVFVFR